MTQRTCGVYALVDPRTFEIRYVGQSVHVEYRFKEHLLPQRSPPHLPVCRWIKLLLRIGLRPRLLLLEQCSTEQLDSVETKWITVLRERGELLNCTDGGHGSRGYQFTPEEKERRRVFQLGRRFKQKQPRTEEHRKKLSRSIFIAKIRRGYHFR